eukprot:scaffold55710_cov25-Tisochrysis_lutea.AAC.4
MPEGPPPIGEAMATELRDGVCARSDELLPQGETAGVVCVMAVVTSGGENRAHQACRPACERAPSRRLHRQPAHKR